MYAQQQQQCYIFAAAAAAFTAVASAYILNAIVWEPQTQFMNLCNCPRSLSGRWRSNLRQNNELRVSVDIVSFF